MRLLSLLLAALILGTGASFAQQAVETMAVTIQGKGGLTTRALTFQDNWHIESTADAGIKIRAVPADGSAPITLIDSPDTTPPAASYAGTSAPVARGGSYTLEVTTTGTWQITALDSGFTKNLAIGGATPYSPSSANGQAIPGMPGMMPYLMPHDHTVTMFGGMGPTTTRQFTVKNDWQVQWTAYGPIKMTLVPADGSNPTVIMDTMPKGGLDEPLPSTSSSAPSTPSPPSPYPTPFGMPTNMRHGVFPQTTGGDFTIQVEGKSQWMVRVAEENGNNSQVTAASFQNGMPGATPATPPSPAAPAPIVKLTDDQTRAVVLIKGDNSEGTGFLVKMPDGPVVVTNIHVIANNPNLKITTNTGAVVTMLSAKGASDRDLALLSIKDANYSYLELSADVGKTAQNGDAVVTPGNSEGGEVMLNTGGKVLGIGPERIEIDNPIYHGNSGGPIFHTASGKVLGVVTEAMKVDTSNALDKASYASGNSAISGSMRYFGLRLDTVPSWVPIDWNRFQSETAFLDQFHHRSRCLDSYVNTPDPSQGGSVEANKELANLYKGDEKIMKANDTFTQQVSGADASQRLQALKELLFDLQGIADTNLNQLQNAGNFYSFDQEWAEDEIEYRKALKKELDSIGNNVERLGSLPRANN